MKAKYKLFTGTLLLLLSVNLTAAAVPEENTVPKQNIQTSSLSNTLVGINTLYQYLNTNFLWDIDVDNVEESLTKALLASLDDPYSVYITEDEKADFDETITGKYVGIGTYLTKYPPEAIDNDDPTTYMVQISAPFPGGPADRAGIRPLDLISHINGESVYSLTANEASKKMRGEAGVPITITVHRGTAVFDVTLTPEEVEAPYVNSEVIKGTEYGYLSIVDFSQSTYEMVSRELTKLQNQNIKGLIIDLRNNTGGIVDASILISNYFLEDGATIVSTKFKDGSGKQNFTTIATDDTRKYMNLPLVILVNEGTASASEIMTAALQENDRATVIGSQTFGKGIMQDVVPWNGGYIKYTSAHYLTPDGNDIHEVGITPDIVVEDKEYTDEELEAYFAFIDTHEDATKTYIEENPEYSMENIQAYADSYADENIPSDLLKYYIRNNYIYSLPFNERPLTDADLDEVLKRAIEFHDSGK